MLIFLSTCSDLKPIITILYKVVDLIKFFVPMLLILFGTLDLAKAVIAGKEDEMKKAQSTLIKRCIYAAAVFFIFILVKFLMGFISIDGATNWVSCWKGE